MAVMKDEASDNCRRNYDLGKTQDCFSDSLFRLFKRFNRKTLAADALLRVLILVLNAYLISKLCLILCQSTVTLKFHKFQFDMNAADIKYCLGLVASIDAIRSLSYLASPLDSKRSKGKVVTSDDYHQVSWAKIKSGRHFIQIIQISLYYILDSRELSSLDIVMCIYNQVIHTFYLLTESPQSVENVHLAKLKLSSEMLGLKLIIINLLLILDRFYQSERLIASYILFGNLCIAYAGMYVQYNAYYSIQRESKHKSNQRNL